MANPLYGQNKTDNGLDKVGSKVIVVADDYTLVEGDSGATVFVQMDEDATPTPFSLVVTASDEIVEILTWKVVINPAVGVATVSGTGATPVVGYTAPENYSGNVTFALEVTDQYLFDTTCVLILSVRNPGEYNLLYSHDRT